MTDCSTESFDFAPVEGREVVAGIWWCRDDLGCACAATGGSGSCDRVDKIDLRLVFTTNGAELIEHDVATLVGQREFGIALGYEDLNEHDDCGTIR